MFVGQAEALPYQWITFKVTTDYSSFTEKEVNIINENGPLPHHTQTHTLTRTDHRQELKLQIKLRSKMQGGSAMALSLGCLAGAWNTS